MLVSNASAIGLSGHPSPASDMSAFSRIRTLSSLRAGCLPVVISSFSRLRSSSLNLTIYFLAVGFLVTNRLRRCQGIDSKLNR